MKVTGSAPAGACTIALVDQSGKQATKTIATLGQDDWQELQLPLAAFKAEAGFDMLGHEPTMVQVAKVCEQTGCGLCWYTQRYGS